MQRLQQRAQLPFLFHRSSDLSSFISILDLLKFYQYAVKLFRVNEDDRFAVRANLGLFAQHRDAFGDQFRNRLVDVGNLTHTYTAMSVERFASNKRQRVSLWPAQRQAQRQREPRTAHAKPTRRTSRQTW